MAAVVLFSFLHFTGSAFFVKTVFCGMFFIAMLASVWLIPKLASANVERLVHRKRRLR
ncbi:hypothetical protein [Ferviditalea candida]|uniref:Uncharacterized protein n=1 Tax=Ferviditalea candida TaxID=3108399 RepID=A0ABU5ZFY1_9BACL|nr:hypothetical protein [Paenibacillaceae bacterium T2]